MKSTPSLRRKLLLWLIGPLLTLIAMDTTILYRFAMGAQREAFDNALYDSAYDISQIINRSDNPVELFKLPREADQIILADKIDQVFYNIIDANNGQVLGGDAELRFSQPSVRNKSGTYFHDGKVHGKSVRIVTTAVIVNTYTGFQPVYIQVAETLNKRHMLADQILIGIIIPQLLLVVIAFAVVWFGIGRGLQPLWELQFAVSTRSDRDLSAIRMPNLPVEVTTLVDSVNTLMYQLDSVLQSQNRFIADAAHQLRTPLAGAQAQLELAQQESDPAQLQQLLQRVSAGMERLSHTVSQLLALARNQPEVAKVLALNPVDLNLLAQQVATDMVPAAFQKDIDLGYEGPESEDGIAQPVLIAGDTGRLKEMLYNLVDNAIRYTQKGGKVTVRVSLKAHKVALIVEDNGPGIPKEEQQKVFERFHRVIGSNQEGSGLGLAIVMEIAQIHNAHVDILDKEGYRGIQIQILFSECPSLRE